MSDTDGTLAFQLVDARGNAITEHVDIVVQSMQLQERHVVKNVDAGKTVLGGLRRQPEGMHLVEIDPPSYLQVSSIVTIPASGGQLVKLPFAIDPKKVSRVDFPLFAALQARAQDLLNASSVIVGLIALTGDPLYRGIDDLQRAGFLNITAKAASCILSSQIPVLSYVRQVTTLRGDRFFCRMDPEVVTDLKNTELAGRIKAVDSLLHQPDPGFTHAGSFKTLDPYANLQVTLFTDGTVWTADIDIDDANGFAHVFQVVDNSLTHKPTHPYNIHELLLASQDLDPGYALVI